MPFCNDCFSGYFSNITMPVNLSCLYIATCVFTDVSHFKTKGKELKLK